MEVAGHRGIKGGRPSGLLSVPSRHLRRVRNNKAKVDKAVPCTEHNNKVKVGKAVPAMEHNKVVVKDELLLEQPSMQVVSHPLSLHQMLASLVIVRLLETLHNNLLPRTNQGEFNQVPDQIGQLRALKETEPLGTRGLLGKPLGRPSVKLLRDLHFPSLARLSVSCQLEVIAHLILPGPSSPHDQVSLSRLIWACRRQRTE